MASKPVLGVPSTMGDSYQLNIRKLFERGALLQPNSQIVEMLDNGTNRITYRQAQKQTRRISSILCNNYNINIGDSVGTFMWTNMRHTLLFYSISCMGSIFSPINFRLHPNDLKYIINFAKHKIIFIDEDLLFTYFDKIPLEALLHVTHLVICGENGKPSNRNNINKLRRKYVRLNINVIDFDTDFMHSNINASGSGFNHDQYIYPELDERTGAALLFTSGTTGNPKGSLYGHRSLYIHILNMGLTDSFNLSGTDCVLSFPQLFHVLSALFSATGFTYGHKVLLIGRCNDYNKILDFCFNEKCTLINGVPTVIQSFRHSLRANPAKYQSMKGVLTRVGVGGSAPPKDLIDYFWNNWNVEMIQVWGMSETQGISYVGRRCTRRSDLLLTENEKNQNCGFGGIPFPSIHGKVIKEPNKEMGEFYVNGPIAISSYYGNTNTGYKFDEKGWLKTGDIVSYTDKQQIIIHDRSKDMIKSGGEWISSQDMETYIASKYASKIEKCCVVGVFHEILRERPIVIIQLYDKNDGVSVEDIINKLKEKYANFQLPDDILFWDEIPVTGTGKVSKKDVRLKLKKEKYILPKISLRKRMQSKL